MEKEENESITRNVDEKYSNDDDDDDNDEIGSLLDHKGDDIVAPPLLSSMTREFNVEFKEEVKKEQEETLKDVRVEKRASSIDYDDDDDDTEDLQIERTVSPITDTEIVSEDEENKKVEEEEEDAPVIVNMNRAAERVIMSATKLWLDDSLSDVCMNASCSSEFTFLNRRAHCRLCGLIFCKSCVSNTRVLPPSYRYGENEEKVCVSCATLIDRRSTTCSISPRRMLERRRKMFRHADLTKVSESKEEIAMMEKDEGEEELAIHRQVYRAIGPKRLETSCHSCLRPFSITLRRHHCRRCGRATCSECSSKTRLLKSHNYGEEKVRHCDECYEKGDEISRLCLKGDSKLQFKSRVLFSMRGKRKIYEVRTYLVHENFSVNVERMYEDFYWLHKSLLSEHPKQRLPRLVLSDEESVTRYVNAILTHELLISNASSVRAFFGLTSRVAFEVYTGRHATKVHEEDSEDENRRVVETLADLSELPRMDGWLTFAIAQQRFRERTGGYKKRQVAIQDRLAEADTRRERHEMRAKKSSSRFECFRTRSKIAENILSPCPSRFQRENDRLVKQSSTPQLVFIDRIEDAKCREEAESRLNELKIAHMKSRQELDLDQKTFSDDQRVFLESKKMIASEVASDDWEDKSFHELACTVRETFESRSSRRQRLQLLFDISQEEFENLSLSLDKERESIDLQSRIFEKEAHILARDDTKCDEEELILRNVCDALEEEHDVIKKERLLRKEKEANVMKDLTQRETLLSEMRTQRDEAEKDVRSRVEEVSKRKEKELNLISSLESTVKYVTRVLKRFDRRCSFLMSCTKRQQKSEYVLKFEDEVKEEEEKDRWQIRFERFQDKERMMILNHSIQSGLESFDLNLNTYEKLSNRMEKDRDLLKQGNPRTEHECEKHHESDEFVSNVLSRRVEIDRELRKDVEMMETHGDSLEILRKHNDEGKERVEEVKELKEKASRLFEQTQQQSESVRVANETFLNLKKQVRERLEAPLRKSLYNSEVRVRDTMSRKLKRDRRRTRRRDEFHVPLDGISRDLDQTFVRVKSQETRNKEEDVIRLETIIKSRGMISKRLEKWSQDQSRLHNMESKIENLSQTLRDRAKSMDVDSEACETDIVSLQKDLNDVTETWGKYPGRQKHIENQDAEFVSMMESKCSKLNASHQAERESLNKEKEELKEEQNEWKHVREKMSKITSRLEKLNHEFEIERCELQKDVEFWTNCGKEMMDTLRFEMSELREMMRLCSSSEGVATVPFDERTSNDNEQKEEEEEEEEEEKCIDVEIMV